MADDLDKVLGTPEYWNEHYAKSDGKNPTHEWLRSWKELQPFMTKTFLGDHQPESSPRILHLGSGDSTIPADLAALGYNNQQCLDFSPAVVEMMTARHASIDGIEWSLGDVRDMKEVPSQSVDLAFDKSTLDPMVYGDNPWDPPDEVKENISKYLTEVHRVVKDDGLYICVSFRQPHFIRRLVPDNGSWNMTVEALGSEGFLGYHAYIFRKSTQ